MVLAQISAYLFASAAVPKVKTTKSSGPAEPALSNMTPGLCSEPPFCHIRSSGLQISTGICVMCHISRPNLTLHVYLHLIQDSAAKISCNYLVWLLVCFLTPNLRYFSLPEVVWVLSMTSLLKTSSGSYV